MANCWEKAVPLAFHLCYFYFSAVLIVGVPFPFGVAGRIWNSIVQFLIIAFLSTLHAAGTILDNVDVGTRY